MKRMLSTDEAAAALRVSAVTIFRYVDQGKLPAERVGLRRVIQINPADLKAFAESYGIACHLPDEDDQ